MSAFYISASHKSSGKTTLSIGLCAALSRRGETVQPFKKGPDYIDPMWLSLAAGNPAYNLDFYTQTREEISELFLSKSASSSVQLVEGNKGLFDGLDLEGNDCNAAMAKHLNLPVILVLNTSGTIRGVAPLIQGYEVFDRDVSYAGVILNNVGGPRHESKLRSVIEHYTDMRILGAVPKSNDITLVERHLGLIPSNEEGEALVKVSAMADQIIDNVDIDTLLDCTKTDNSLVRIDSAPDTSTIVSEKITIGVVKDSAFGFYYQDDLDELMQLGASIVYIDSIKDTDLPQNLDGLFIGGGFPESFAGELSSNVTLKESIKSSLEQGMPIYAECGGLMYLSNSIILDNKKYPMVGAIDGDAEMSARPKGRGYTQITPNESLPWNLPRSVMCAHEFHYSSLSNISDDSVFGFDISRGEGITGSKDAYVYKNTVAGFNHLRNTLQSPWCKHFINFVRKVSFSKKQGRTC